MKVEFDEAGALLINSEDEVEKLALYSWRKKVLGVLGEDRCYDPVLVIDRIILTPYSSGFDFMYETETKTETEIRKSFEDSFNSNPVAEMSKANRELESLKSTLAIWDIKFEGMSVKEALRHPQFSSYSKAALEYPGFLTDAKDDNLKETK